MRTDFVSKTLKGWFCFFTIFILLILSGCTDSYSVTFVDEEGGALYQTVIEEGNDVIPPSAPNIKGYTFTGWSESYTNIQSDLIIQAQYDLNVYNIEFIDYNEDVLLNITVNHGEGVDAPQEPDREGYSFIGWSHDFKEITSDLEITAQYEILTYTVNFYDYADQLLSQLEVEHGGTVDAPQEPDREGYTFIGWSHDFDSITEDLDIFTVYEINYFDVTFLDADGTVLSLEALPYDSMPTFSLPDNTSAWEYLEWSPSLTNVDEDTSYTALRNLKESYFYGNVFQIIIYDLGEIPIGVGTGFVFDEEGWFITNAHVMKDGYYADAIFEIPNTDDGSRYFNLEIDTVIYFDLEKDIFIGKLSDYSDNLGDHFQNFSFTETYEIGDQTFSIGYPDAVTDLEIHEGSIVEDISSLYDKVYTGVRYIGSTSFVASGSSGGVLINNNLEVLGITSIGLYDDAGDFEISGSVESFNFMHLVNNLDSSKLTDYAIKMHPSEEDFITFFRSIKSSENAEIEYYDTYTRYIFTWETEDVNDEGFSYIRTEKLYIDSDRWINYFDEIYWDDGDYRFTEFYGFYSYKDKFSNFTFNFYYEWGSGNYYRVESSDINYSENIDLTLINHTVTSSANFSPTQSNINYAKQNFNGIYKWLYDWLYPE